MKKILIVDDTKGIRRMILRNLRKRHYEVFEAESGPEALKMLESENYDLVLMDQNMPFMSGLETFEKIKNDVPTPPPVIMITAEESLQLVVAFMKSGGADFIEKPIDIELLDARIKQSLKASELEIDNKNLMELNRVKTELLSNVSHELRTPLTSIKSMSEILIDDLEDLGKEKTLAYLAIIHKESGRLTRLINNLLNLRKIENADSYWNDEEIDIKTLIEQSVDQFMPLAENSGLDLFFEVGEEFPDIFADEDRVIQVLENLVTNAIKFSDKGGLIKISAKINNEDESDTDIRSLVVSVSDEGPGIPPEAHEKVFESFSQVDSSATRKHGGTGLGLTISKEIVEHYGGKIWLESAIGKGSTFSFSLPLR